MELTINIQAPEIANAIHALAKAIDVNTQGNLSAKNALASTITVLADVLESNGKALGADQAAATSAPAEAVIPTPPPIHEFSAAPVAPIPTAPAYSPTPAPAPVAPPPAAVPVAPQTYTLDQLAVAATQLVDAGRRTELVSLLNSFGVQALTALPKEQYGAFATQLRAMGAKI